MTHAGSGRRPALWVDLIIFLCAGVLFVGLILLGNWQVQRLAWKTDLIAAVNERTNAEAVALPLSQFDPDTHAYLKVGATGQFEHEYALQVKAVTDLGPGYWLMTPLKTDWGRVWINRGFLPIGLDEAQIYEPEGLVSLSGLVRISEPKGTVLQANRPQDAKWFSRDVAVMSKTAGFEAIPDYFVDGDHLGVVEAWPRGGLTRIRFTNNHLVYAITWYGLAAMVLIATAFFVTRGSKYEAIVGGSISGATTSLMEEYDLYEFSFGFPDSETRAPARLRTIGAGTKFLF